MLRDVVKSRIRAEDEAGNPRSENGVSRVANHLNRETQQRIWNQKPTTGHSNQMTKPRSVQEEPTAVYYQLQKSQEHYLGTFCLVR